MRRNGYDVVMATFCVALVISNVTAQKLVTVWGFTLTGGTLLFPITYVFGDILTEVYGYAAARRVIWTGFALQIAAVLCIMLAIAMPAAIPPQGATFDRALDLSAWIVVGSLTAYWCGEFVNSYVLARLKVLTAGRWLWTRTIGSTVAGQAVDTVVFVAVAFWLGNHVQGHPLPMPVLWRLVWSVYLFKVGVEVVMTPATYALVQRLKGGAPEHFDRAGWNPFALSDGR